MESYFIPKVNQLPIITPLRVKGSLVVKLACGAWLFADILS